MNQWVKVATDPIGLAGFALFLVFSFLSNKGKKLPWLAKCGFAMACVALIGGLIVAYYRVRPSPTSFIPAKTVNEQNIGNIDQQSTGNGSINAAGVQGQMTVNKSGPASPTPASKREKKR